MGGGFLTGLLLGFIVLRGMSLPVKDNLATGVQFDGPQVGKPAADFELYSLEGDLVRLSDLRGKVVLINFWATWCGPCREEMPSLDAISRNYSDHLVVIGIDADESKDIVSGFIEELDVSFLILIDKGSTVQSEYLVRGLPASFFIDEKGILRIQHIGVLNVTQIETYLGMVGVIE